MPCIGQTLIVNPAFTQQSLLLSVSTPLTVQFSSVKLVVTYRLIYVSRTFMIKSITAVLTSSSYVKHFSFQPASELS